MAFFKKKYWKKILNIFTVVSAVRIQLPKVIPDKFPVSVKTNLRNDINPIDYDIIYDITLVASGITIFLPILIP